MSSRDPNLVALLSRVAQGDADAFSDLYLASSSKLFAVALRILRNRELAEEVVQEAYVKIWSRAGDFKPDIASPITWMAAIVRNRALDEVRRRGGRVFVDDGALENLESEEESAVALLERQDDVARLQRCLEGLEAEKRKMVCLAYLEGMSREDLARKFDKPEGTVKTWLRRSLMQLKGCLEQ